MRRYVCAFAIAAVAIGGATWLSRVHVEAQPRGKSGLRRALRRVPRRRRQRRRSSARLPDAAAARLHDRQVQDTHHRNRHVPTDDDLIAIGASRSLRHRDARLGSDPEPTPTSPTSCSTSSRCRRGFNPKQPKPVAIGRREPPELAGQPRARRAGIREAAVRQVPWHRRPRHRRGDHHVRGRLADAAARRRPHRTVDVSRRRDVARHLPAVPHRHDRHADAFLRGRGERRRDVGPRQLRRVAGAQAGVGDERRRESSSSTHVSRRRRRPIRCNAASSSSTRSAARSATRRSTARNGCCPE